MIRLFKEFFFSFICNILNNRNLIVTFDFKWNSKRNGQYYEKFQVYSCIEFESIRKIFIIENQTMRNVLHILGYLLCISNLSYTRKMIQTQHVKLYSVKTKKKHHFFGVCTILMFFTER